MDINKDQQQEDTRHFSDKWLDNIFDVLMRIEEYERLAKNGCRNLSDYLENPQIDLAVTQEKNYQFFMTEIQILLNDIKFFIKRENYLKISLKFNSIRKKEKEVGGFLLTFRNYVNQTSKNSIREEFSFVLPLLSELRGMLIQSLFEFINPKINIKFSTHL